MTIRGAIHRLQDRFARSFGRHPDRREVPDAASLSALTHRLDEIPPAIAPEPAATTAHHFTADVAKALRDAWPNAGTGDIVAISLDLDHPDRVRVSHLGTPLGEAGTQLLARALEPVAGKLDIAEETLLPISADAADGARWLPQALELIRRADEIGSLHACVMLATPPVKDRRARADDGIATVRGLLLQAVQGTEISVEDGDHWSIVVQRDACARSAGSDAGSGSGA